MLRNEGKHSFVRRTTTALLLYEFDYQKFIDAMQETILHAAEHCILCIAIQCMSVLASLHFFGKQTIAYFY